MGQYRETARKAGDAALLKRDILADALARYDGWEDMKDGPGALDIEWARQDYAAEGLDPDEAGADLRAAMAAHYAERMGRARSDWTLRPAADVDYEDQRVLPEDDAQMTEGYWLIPPDGTEFYAVWFATPADAGR